MGGLQRLFLRITPIIMLICFICFGITHTFQEEGQPNITYLTHETIEVIADNPLTQENEQVTIENYNFDFKSYRENIDINILKRATNNIIDIEAYQKTKDEFNNIWKNGYNAGDIVRTIGNASLLIINTLILPINILIAPLRIISGILLTAFSILGININRQTPIINVLNSILDNAAIPMLRPTFSNDPNSIINTKWKFNNEIKFSYQSYSATRTYVVNFTIPESTATYTKIRTTVNFLETENTIEYFYLDENNVEQSLYVYNNGWIYQNTREITIISHNMTQEQYELFMTFLNAYATQLN